MCYYNGEDSDESDNGSDNGSEDWSLPSTQWDATEHVFHCLVCSWEVVNCVCEACQTEYRRDEVCHASTPG